MFPDMFEIFNEGSSKPAGSAQQGSSNAFVISIGGSLLIAEEPDADYISKFCRCINSLQRSGYRFAIVVGGGRTCRAYQEAQRALGANNFMLDELGIAITRVNARLLLPAVENAHPQVISELGKAKEVFDAGKIPILGGLMPGFTTDASAALLSEYLGANFVNLSNVDGIYDADPEKKPRAKLLDSLTYEELMEIVGGQKAMPGQHVIIDMPACLILRRSGIRAFFINGNDLENFEACISGRRFKGTIVEGSSEIGEEDVEEA